MAHHNGGRHARSPAQRPSENANAAQKRGCRGGLESRIIFRKSRRRMTSGLWGYIAHQSPSPLVFQEELGEDESGQRPSSITDSM